MDMKTSSEKTFMQQLKDTLPRLWDFFLCNLLSFAGGAVVIILTGLFAGILVEKASENRFWSDLIFDLAVTIGFVFVFYFKFFVANQEYKRFYFRKMDEGYSVQAWMKAHLTEYSKYEFILLLIISVIPVIVPSNGGLSFLFTSACIFVDFVPRYFITSIPPFLARLIGVIFWDAFIVGTYLVCLRLVYRKWEKGRLGTRNSQQGGNTI